ncbi:hypothetical protein [Myroides odoratus]|uniref:Outer membrane protein beta-barrel domain-containing protein n=1 Tax=Myroides odoratus TaxID=256 RepID=A0A9Q7E809_MYROD|nr:hypothetical protein [Myroides odoratus]EHQ42716.1 hypothetical protein Myrod_1884 [Myroides odoratus DSM 2801]EKB07703.1 hypothetical protein HMPREF9716_01742 [Myroides odoratus CIP 103059]QQU00076.1 hypothetical protein I6I88_18245 [Myroides odoratus]WQD57704.1 hypothetical protein U0010_00705 [Myroides odoratus]STZ29980.1 Uncharacterised protein [Myroides odoratus]
MNLQRFLFLFLFWYSCTYAQEGNSLYQQRTWEEQQTTLQLPLTPLNNSYFEILDAQEVVVPTSVYRIDFDTNTVTLLQANLAFPLTVYYLELPSFLTTPISYYDTSRIVPNEAGSFTYQHQTNNRVAFVPFEGLNTMGSLSRGLTMGTNQSAVTSSNLDLQITGNLSDRVKIRASIQDNNLPLQYGGYSQKINEFDQIFIELFSDDWSIRAGDIYLENRARRFLNFNKKVQGLSTRFVFDHGESKTTVEAAAALARGQYTRSTFNGQEGNQGPYKLKGSNGELYILIVSGSEKVYVNGLLLKRGEENDYVIDYNSGELRFTTRYPITSDMRIAVEYQYTDRNYTRFVGYGNIQHEAETWQLGLSVFTETDLKNQSLQQNLTEEQIDILKQAGNDPNRMIAPSAYRDTYSENKVLYTREQTPEGQYYFVFSTDPEAELYHVTFTAVGNNQGDYVIQSTQSIGRIYEYRAPVGGIPQGNYSPVVKLIAPIQNTIATINAAYHPSEKTAVDLELAFSNHDANLFSSIDQEENKGWATALKGKQRLWTHNQAQLNVLTDIQFIHKNFHALENLFSIEFDRDWNLQYAEGNQSLVTGGLEFLLPGKASATYLFEQLNFGTDYKGNRQNLAGKWQADPWLIQTQNSLMQADGLTSKTTFIQSHSQAKYHWRTNYIGTKLDFEQNKETNQETQLLNPLSHRYSSLDLFIGKGDSLGQNIELGYQFRLNDSLQNNQLQRFSKAHTFYLKSQLLKSETRDLNLYANYRSVRHEDTNKPTENTINSVLTYRDQFFKGFVQAHTLYEISAGTIAQQEYTYLEVEPGRGQYMWIDYNNNGIQELEEFELAPYPDLGKYVRLYLPSQVFLPTNQNKFTQTLTLNPAALWQNETGIKRILAFFYNQTSYSIDRKDLKKGNQIRLHPFTADEEQMVGLLENFNNYLYYNRGKKRHSVTYMYTQSKSKNLLSFGSTENTIKTHQLGYNHLIRKTWLVDLLGKTTQQETKSPSYASKNYELQIQGFETKLSYLFSSQAQVDIFYNFQEKKNQTADFETLEQHRLGVSFAVNQIKLFTMNGEFSFFQNTFTGNAFSPIGYQMLEGLQPGKNMTWRLMFQKNLTNYLDLSLNYQGRSNESTATIHTGSVQLRAFF